MRIFLYEFVTGGGWMFDEPPPVSLVAEAKAMVYALAADLTRIPAIEVVLLCDARWPLGLIRGVTIERSVPPDGDGNLAPVFRLARECDVTLVIAPEFMGIASRYVAALERGAIRLLSPPGYFVSVASDKADTFANIKNHVQVPQTRSVSCTFDGELPSGLTYPLVVKPRDGCGSIGVQLLRSTADRIDWSSRPGYLSGDEVIVQQFVPGLAASVALLCGPAGVYALPACKQILSDDDRFQYLGGECPLPAPLALRAEQLAQRALGGLPNECGYVGVDMILGDADDGSQDYVIEINPRLTTSYAGLRVLCKTNLAEAMLDVIHGRAPRLEWHGGTVRWSADGVVQRFGG